MTLENKQITELAKAMFDAYNNQSPNPWKSWDGKDVPRWHELNDQVRGKWEAAAKSVFEWLGENR